MENNNKAHKIKISEVNIMPVQPKEDGLIAIVSVNFNEMLALGSIALYKKSNGYRLSYPLKKIGENRWSIFKPISKEAGDAIEKAILDEYDKVLTQDITEAVEDDD